MSHPNVLPPNRLPYCRHQIFTIARLDSPYRSAPMPPRTMKKALSRGEKRKTLMAGSRPYSSDWLAGAVSVVAPAFPERKTGLRSVQVRSTTSRLFPASGSFDAQPQCADKPCMQSRLVRQPLPGSGALLHAMPVSVCGKILGRWAVAPREHGRSPVRIHLHIVSALPANLTSMRSPRNN